VLFLYGNGLQAKNTSIARQRACDESKNAYAAELQKTNHAQHEHYHALMPRVFDVCVFHSLNFYVFAAKSSVKVNYQYKHNIFLALN